MRTRPPDQAWKLAVTNSRSRKVYYALYCQSFAKTHIWLEQEALSVGAKPQAAILRSIELLGTVVAPKVRAELLKRKVSA